MMFLLVFYDHHPKNTLAASATVSTGYRHGIWLNFVSWMVFYEDGLLHTCSQSNLTRTDDLYGNDTFVIKNVSCEQGKNSVERALLRHRSSSDRYGPKIHPF